MVYELSMKILGFNCRNKQLSLIVCLALHVEHLLKTVMLLNLQRYEPKSNLIFSESPVPPDFQKNNVLTW